MKRLDRRKFMLMASVGATGAVLTACGNDPDDQNLNPTMIPDVPGAPPTLAPNATPGGGAAEGDKAESEQPAAGGSVVELEASDPYNWSTNELSASPGQVIKITNTGALPHDFSVDEWDVKVDLPGGESAEVTVPDTVAVGDTYTYYCSVAGHRENGMEGTLTIVEASAAPAEGGEASPAAEEATPAAGGDAPAAAGATTAEIAAIELAFEPSELSIAAGTDVKVTFTNNGVLPHDFVIDELDIASSLLDGGATEEITINAPAGTYTFYCSQPGHKDGGMEGTLTVA